MAQIETPHPSQASHDPWVDAGVYKIQKQLTPLINPTDAVYLNAETGRAIKVRVKRIANPNKTYGTVIVEVSGAHCDPATGRALRRVDAEDGDVEVTAFQIAPASTMTFKAGVDPELFTRELERRRLIVAAATERAVQAEEFIAALPG